MQTVSIRELSGDLIARATSQGQTLGVTNMGGLVGVVVPLTKEVLEGIAHRDEGARQARVREAETEMASGRPLGTLSELLDEGSPPAPGARSLPKGWASFSRVGIRDLSGARLEQAARDGEALLVSSGRVTLALLIPVTPDWVEHLVEGGIKRFIDGDSDSGVAVRDTRRDALPAGELGVPAARTISGREFLRQRAIGIRIIADASDGPSRLQGVLTDMLARAVGERVERTLESVDEVHVVAEILSLVDDLRAQMGTDERLIGVGLEIGGHVHEGGVVYSANAHWMQFPLEDRLRNILRLPVVLENDANALAIYERRFEGVAENNLAVMLLTRFGVGCGLILDGHIYRGVHGMGGEIGHIPMSMNGDGEILCRCRNPDCLECVATPRAIEEALRQSAYDGDYDTALKDSGSERAREAFESAGTALGRASATVINILNPSAMVFYGPPDLLGTSREFHIGGDPRTEEVAPHYASAMIKAIRNHAFSTGASDCLFTVRTSVEKYSARAAAACLIDSVVPEARVQDDRPIVLQTR